MSISPAEIEFLAEEEIVKVTPRFSLGRSELICGDFGPFNPGVPTKIPLWLAINLRQRGLCILHVPEWLTIEKLTAWHESENEKEKESQKPLHSHYREISRLILKNCSDSIKDVDQIGQFIEDIWNIRVAKLRLAVQTVEKNRVETEMPDHGGLYEVSDYTQLEINYVRTLFIESLNNTFIIATATNALENLTTQDRNSLLS